MSVAAHGAPSERDPTLDDTDRTLELLARLSARRLVAVPRGQVEAAREAAVGRLRHALVVGGVSVSETAATVDRFGDALAVECQRLAAVRRMRGAA